MVFTVKKTTTVTTKTTRMEAGKTIETVETTTSTSDGSDADAHEVEQAMRESSDAMSRLFDGFQEKLDAVFKPFDRLHKKPQKDPR